MSITPALRRVEAGRSEVQGYAWLYNKFEATLGYVRLCPKNRYVFPIPEAFFPLTLGRRYVVG